MNLQNLLNSRLGVALALFLSRSIPPAIGYGLANRIADFLASRRDLLMVRSIRANQWVVTGEKLSTAELDEQVKRVLRHTGHCLYDLYHNMQDPTASQRMVHFAPAFEDYVERAREGKQGFLFVSAHISSFDMALRAMVQHGLRCQILSVPEPPGGYRWQNQMRREAGLEITPMSIAALRQASDRLREGGCVLTGVDRPIPEEKYRPRFFGRLSSLPVTHVRLALKTRVPVVVLGNQMLADGTCCVDASESISMKPDPDLETELVRNAEAILDVVTGYVRRVPQQWSMFYPVWPELLTETP